MAPVGPRLQGNVASAGAALKEASTTSEPATPHSATSRRVRFAGKEHPSSSMWTAALYDDPGAECYPAVSLLLATCCEIYECLVVGASVRPHAISEQPARGGRCGGARPRLRTRCCRGS